MTTPDLDAIVPCNQHPDAPHGLDRNASHSLRRYVCECENWQPDATDAVVQPPLPCPFCGHHGALDFDEGETFHWLAYSCGGCGMGSETRVQTVGKGTPESWLEQARLDAVTQWNRRAPAAILADRERRDNDQSAVESVLRAASAWAASAARYVLTNGTAVVREDSEPALLADAFTQVVRAALSAPVGAAAPVVAGPVGWIDQFGNLFHLGAWVPSRATYHDSYKTPWQPVYRAAPVGAAPDVPSPPPLFASSVARRKWESLQADGYRMQSITFEREGRRGWIDPWGTVMWAQVASTIDAAAGT